MHLVGCTKLQAIYSSEFHLISSSPPCFTVKLREPDPLRGDDDSSSGDNAQQQQGPPSQLFTLKFKLPKVRCD
jgi:hypothetical protein